MTNVIKTGILAVVLMITFEVSGQQAKNATLTIIIDGKENANNPFGSKAKVLLPSQSDLYLGDEFRLESLDTLNVVIYNSNNPEFVSQYRLNMRETPFATIEFENQEYLIKSEGKNIELKKSGREPASGENKSLKLRSASNLFLTFKCKNHSPSHSYSDPDKIDPKCCFVTNCN